VATRTLLIGLGKGGTALLPYLLADSEFELIGVCDSSYEAVGRALAQRLQIPFFDDARRAVNEIQPQIVIDATGDPSLPAVLYQQRPAGTSIVTGQATRILWEMLAAKEAQRRVELRYERLLSDMRSGLLVVENAKVRFANRAFLNLLGYSAEEVLGRSYVDFVAPEFRERDLKYHLARLAGEPAPEEHETRLLHKNGSTLTVMVRARLSEWDGRPASLAIITDITALRELQRERERFFRFMVHELRAPLSPLVTAVSLFRNPEVLADKTRLEGLLRLVTRSVNRLQTFVDDFLELSKLDQETLVVTQEELDLQQIVEEVLDGQRLLAEDKGLEIVVEPWQKFRILGDAFAVRTVIQNLINNAIKYTDKGRVTVSASQKDGRFAIRVADTGSGLTPDEQATLFQEFGRIQRTAGVKGSGLGLALVKKLVDACGGSVTAHSEGRNQGSVFTVELPCVFGKPQNGASHKEAN